MPRGTFSESWSGCTATVEGMAAAPLELGVGMSVRVEIPPGRSVAGCCGCGEVFTCVSAFDKHQHLIPEDQGGGVECLDPEAVGLRLYERPDKDEPDNPWLLWGWPSGDNNWYDKE
jgi:hypothetical protein